MGSIFFTFTGVPKFVLVSKLMQISDGIFQL